MSAAQHRPTRAESHGWQECMFPIGRTSACAKIATHLIESKGEVNRIARLASRSAASFKKYAGQLAEAKVVRAQAIENRDRHMAECPGAFDRFGELSSA